MAWAVNRKVSVSLFCDQPFTGRFSVSCVYNENLFIFNFGKTEKSVNNYFYVSNIIGPFLFVIFISISSATISIFKSPLKTHVVLFPSITTSSNTLFCLNGMLVIQVYVFNALILENFISKFLQSSTL